jgi:hypothetical protein
MDDARYEICRLSYLGDRDEAGGEAEAGTADRRLGGFDLDLAAGSRDVVSLSATDRGREFAVGLLDAMSYAIRQTWAVCLVWFDSQDLYPSVLLVGPSHVGSSWGSVSNRTDTVRRLFFTRLDLVVCCVIMSDDCTRFFDAG